MRKLRTDFTRGMLVRYLGPTPRIGGRDRIKHGGTYTVAHCGHDGATQWLFLQELPGEKHEARDFIHTHHLPEDHWVGAHA